MGYDLRSHNQTPNPVDPEEDSWGYLDKEIELKNYFRFNVDAWPKILDLAEIGGWQPMGTQAPARYQDPEFIAKIDGEAPEWDGGYYGNSGQIVSAEDALRIAAALESVLDDIPDINTAPKVKVFHPGDENPGDENQLGLLASKLTGDLLLGQGIGFVGPNYELTPIDYFSGDLKQKVIDFIAFCRNGAFSIW